MKDKSFTEIDMEESERYFKIPYALIEDEQFEGLSAESILLYGILRDKLSLSYKNREHFTDDNGQIYIIYTNERLMKVLRKRSLTTIVKIKKELHQYGLLLEARQGVNKPNLLYPQKIGFSKNGNPKNENQDFQKMETGNPKNENQDFQKMEGNHTNNNQTNITKQIEPLMKKTNIVFEKLKEAFGEIKISGIVVDKANELVDVYGQDLVLYALDVTALKHADNIYYTISILTNWQKNGVQTVEQAKRYQEEWRKARERAKPKSKPKPTNIPTWSKEHPDYKEPTGQVTNYADLDPYGDEDLPFDE